MMCHFDEQAIHEYVDGRNDEAGRGIIRSHLEECQACAALYRGLMATDGLLRRMPLEQAAGDMTDAVLARIAWTQRRVWVDRLLQPRFMMGAVLVLFGAAGAGGVLAAMHQGPVSSGPSRWVGFLDGLLRDGGGLTESGSAFLMQLAPQLFSAGALNITLTVVLLVPVFFFADRILSRRRVPG